MTMLPSNPPGEQKEYDHPIDDDIVTEVGSNLAVDPYYINELLQMITDVLKPYKYAVFRVVGAFSTGPSAGILMENNKTGSDRIIVTGRRISPVTMLRRYNLWGILEETDLNGIVAGVAVEAAHYLQAHRIKDSGVGECPLVIDLRGSFSEPELD